MVTQNTDTSNKSRLATALLAQFLGPLGLHRFYIGRVISALFILVLFVVGMGGLLLSDPGYWIVCWVSLFVFAVWALSDFVTTLCRLMQDSQDRPVKKW